MSLQRLRSSRPVRITAIALASLAAAYGGVWGMVQLAGHTENANQQVRRDVVKLAAEGHTVTFDKYGYTWVDEQGKPHTDGRGGTRDAEFEIARMYGLKGDGCRTLRSDPVRICREGYRVSLSPEPKRDASK